MFAIAIVCATSLSSGEEPEARSLLGKDLYRTELSEETRKQVEARLQDAIAAYESNPNDVDSYVWVGRRIAYLGKFRESIDWYTKGLVKFGSNAKLLRHRGHRYISIREFEKAVADFEHAARLIAGTKDEIEPDGVPNARNQPISSLHSNVWYHLALAYYLLGKFDKALAACENAMSVASNPDRLVSQTYWKFLTLCRLGRLDDAKKALEPINANLEVIENHAYLRLLLVYKGEITAEQAFAESTSAIEEPTTGYGIGVWKLINGDRETAMRMFESVVTGRNWPAFGYIAAEAELSRQGR